MSTYDNCGVDGAILVLESILSRYDKKTFGTMTVQDVQDHFRTLKRDVGVALQFCLAEKKKAIERNGA